MRGHRFTRAGFADQCQAFTGADIQAQVTHYRLAMEGDIEVADFNQVFSHGHASGSRVEGVTQRFADEYQ